MTFENILVKSQKELKRTLKKELQELRYSPISSKGFLYAKGTVPVLLVAHLDMMRLRPLLNCCLRAFSVGPLSPYIACTE